MSFTIDTAGNSLNSVLGYSTNDEIPTTDTTASDDAPVGETTEILNAAERKEGDEDKESNESQSDVEFDSSSSDSESEVVDLQEEGEFNDDEEKLKDEPIRSKNEIIEQPVIEDIDIDIPATALLKPIGKIVSQVQDALLIQSNDSGEEKVLDVGSILVYEDRLVIGRIFDVFGPVKCPFYSVRFSTETKCKQLARDAGTIVCFVPSLVSVVLTEPLKAMKGTDASNLYDEEIDPKDEEFSDDEKEQLSKKQRKNPPVGDAIPSGSNSRKRKPKRNDFNDRPQPSNPVMPINPQVWPVNPMNPINPMIQMGLSPNLMALGQLQPNLQFLAQQQQMLMLAQQQQQHFQHYTNSTAHSDAVSNLWSMVANLQQGQQNNFQSGMVDRKPPSYSKKPNDQ